MLTILLWIERLNCDSLQNVKHGKGRWDRIKVFHSTRQLRAGCKNHKYLSTAKNNIKCLNKNKKMNNLGPTLECHQGQYVKVCVLCYRSHVVFSISYVTYYLLCHILLFVSCLTSRVISYLRCLPRQFLTRVGPLQLFLGQLWPFWIQGFPVYPPGTDCWIPYRLHLDITMGEKCNGQLARNITRTIWFKYSYARY